MKRILRWLRRGIVGALVFGFAWLLSSVVYQLYAAQRDAGALTAPGRRIDVGGRMMYLRCVGAGSPTVVLESALGAPTVLWQQMQPDISTHTRVCSYDRDGVGWSDESGTPRTAAHYADDLHRLLLTGGERGPFVLVGHSVGGMLALNFARTYPDDVAGMVLLDPTHPKQFAPQTEQWAEHRQMLPYFHAGPTLARLGVARQALWLSDRLKPLPLSQDLRRTYIALMSTPKAMGAMRAEADALFALCDSSAPLPSLGNKPLLVLSASRTLAEGFPAAFHIEMAKLSTRGERRVVDGASHSGLVLNPTFARLSANATKEIVDSVR